MDPLKIHAARAKASAAVSACPALRSAFPTSRQPSTKFGKRMQQIFKDRPGFRIARFNERHATQEGELRPIRGNAAGAVQPQPRLRKVSRRARHARRQDQRRRMIRAQTQAGVRPARGVVNASAPERDCRRQLMRRRVLRSRIQDPVAQNFRPLDPPGAEFSQSVLKRGLSILSWLCHRIILTEDPWTLKSALKNQTQIRPI